MLVSIQYVGTFARHCFAACELGIIIKPQGFPSKPIFRPDRPLQPDLEA